MRFRWIEGGSETESLAVCFRALLAESDRRPTYAELVTALGLGSAATAAAGACLGTWADFGRDAGLLRAASHYGVRLRELHPREAAAGLEQSPEFAQHFHDSYVPLIDRALSSGQLVLAWGGWAAPCARKWGIITTGRAGELRGVTVGNDGREQPLATVATQTYVVEEISGSAERGELSPAPVLQLALQALQRQWCGDWSADRAVQTGGHAYQAFLGALEQHAICRHCGIRSNRCVTRFTQNTIAARRVLAEWLRNSLANLRGTQREQAETWAFACERVVTALSSVPDEAALKSGLATREGRKIVHDAVTAAYAAEAELVRLNCA